MTYKRSTYRQSAEADQLCAINDTLSQAWVALSTAVKDYEAHLTPESVARYRELMGEISSVRGDIYYSATRLRGWVK